MSRLYAHHNSSSLSEQAESKVLILYTGGTIGMKKTERGYEPYPNYLANSLKSLPMLHDPNYDQELFSPPDNLESLIFSIYGCRVIYCVMEYEPLMDSSDMSMDVWAKIAMDIRKYYEIFDGFVILHGTDTMAYTSSALSFMLEDLGKSIILTGAQVPIYEQRSDGRENLLGALIIAGHYVIPEVTLYFDHKLYRGNRVIKDNNREFNAFQSPNFAPLANVGIDIEVQWSSIFRSGKLQKFHIYTSMSSNVGILRLFPGITAETIRTFLLPPMEGVILLSYGSGNAPSRFPNIINEFRKACDRGVLILNISQCCRGFVDDSYMVGKILTNVGIIPGADMTPEAALTKMSYLLGRDDLDLATKRRMLKENLRGELTVRLSWKESEFINSVAQALKATSIKEIDTIQSMLFPVLLCSAAAVGNVSSLKTLTEQGANVNSCDYDGRTPLHLASYEGHVEAVRFLLEKGASVFSRDRLHRTPYIDALLNSQAEVVKILKISGAHLHIGGEEITFYLNNLIEENNVKSLKLWEEAGVDLNLKGSDFRTPLHTVCHFLD
ncbi:uncharacterized protein TRIADDRAFT_30040 [Trichoplax adhaerens]|uniref:asparaginase n=1 Tax=Trichoplax adhaerens TaxID=10228 RepID=B3S6K3_TRIAD|nr:hypothetical protein TRIADDRAFT_30040 [Trichoplax adhaerens]EDV21633.1 hypothetical protein TRIADDRAFT_30040 [Trichoplax adhaerens]|eukprot:XP_002115781.1 hypothetical protein TRIADDRAFT_30040 [Trichoplax adhaerens]